MHAEWVSAMIGLRIPVIENGQFLGYISGEMGRFSAFAHGVSVGCASTPDLARTVVINASKAGVRSEKKPRQGGVVSTFRFLGRRSVPRYGD